MENEHLLHLRDRLKNIILNTCNKIGCDNCDLKWPTGCSATNLESEIMDIELNETK